MKPLRSVQKLVEEQIKKSSLHLQYAAPGSSEAEHWPVVAFSREPGAGGTTLGRSVADHLDFACWDQELLTRIAEESGAVESVLAAVDEQVHSSVTDFVRSLLVGIEYTQDEYRRVLTKVVGGIALNGAAVVVGRGGHLILGAARALRVRVVCPEEERMRRVALRDGLSDSAALKRVREAAADAAAFMKHHFKREIDDPHCFDLIVNSGSLNLVQATDLIIQAYRVKFGRLPTSTGLNRLAQTSARLNEPGFIVAGI